ELAYGIAFYPPRRTPCIAWRDATMSSTAGVFGDNYPVAAQGRRPLRVLTLPDGHAHAALARAPSQRRDRTAVPGSIQVVPGSGGGRLADGVPLCGAQAAACPLGLAGAGVAVVESVATAAWAGRLAGRVAAADPGRLGRAREPCADGSVFGSRAVV